MCSDVAGASCAPLAAAGVGIITLSITWITPFDESMSVATSPAPLIVAAPSFIIGVNIPP